MNDPSKNIPNSASTAEQWVEWHKSLKRWFNLKDTNTIWTKFWSQRAGAGTVADTHDLRTYMDDQGVDVTTTFAGKTTDAVLGVGDWIGETFDWARALLFGGAILALGLIAFYVIHNTRKGRTLAEMTARPQMTSGPVPLAALKMIP